MSGLFSFIFLFKRQREIVFGALSFNLLSSFFIRAPNVRGRIQKKEKEN